MKYVSFTMINRSLSAFVLAIWIIASTAPIAVHAANICCTCSLTGKPEPICLTSDTGSCATLGRDANNPALGNVSCKAIDDGECSLVLEGKPTSKCPAGSAQAKTYVASAPIKEQITLVAPELNVKIPGLNFTTANDVTSGYYSIPFLAQYIVAVYNYLLGISVIAAAIMIIYGGFKYIVSSSLQGVKDGKDIIKDAVIGLVLLFSVYLIFAVLNPNILKLDAIQIQKVKEEPKPDLADFNYMRLLFGQTPIRSSKDASLAAGGAPSGTTTAGTDSSGASSAGCGGNAPAVLIDFPWTPPSYKPNPKSPNGWVPAASKIIVPGSILNCPGSYPVLLWMHGNTDTADKGLDKAIKDASNTHIPEFQRILSQKVTSKQSQPLIIVYPVSYGANASLFPGMTLPSLRDAALAALHSDPRTAGVSFSTVSVGAHSGAGCNPIWGSVQSVKPYAILNADTCFGASNEANQNPSKLVMIVANMHTLNSIYTYQLAVQAYKMEDLKPCPSLPFQIDNSNFSIPVAGGKTFPRMNCMKTPGKDWYMFFAADHNHSGAPAKALTYALDHFFTLQ